MSGKRYAAEIRRLPRLALFEARGDAEALEAAVRAAELPWSAEYNRIAAQDSAELARIGPKRLLVLAPGEREEALDARLEAAFAEVDAADLALVSDAYAGFEVFGPGAENVLRQGAPLDLSAEAFPAGMLAGTELWAVTAIIARLAGAEPGFRLLVEAAHAGYIADWLAVANGGASAAKPGTMLRPPAPIRP